MEDGQFLSLEDHQYCHTCGQSYRGRECGNRTLHRRIERWRNSPPLQYTAEQWAGMHAGTCAVCSRPGRLYAGGWLCDEHVHPKMEQPHA